MVVRGGFLGKGLGCGNFSCPTDESHLGRDGPERSCRVGYLKLVPVKVACGGNPERAEAGAVFLTW